MVAASTHPPIQTTPTDTDDGNNKDNAKTRALLRR